MTAPAPAPDRLLRGSVCGLVTCIVLAVATGLVIVTLGLSDDTWAILFGGTGLLTLLFAVTTAAVFVIRRGRFAPLMAVAVVAAVAGTALVYYLLVTDGSWSREREIAVQLAAALLMGAVGLVYSGIFVLIPTHSRLLLALKVGTVTCAWSIITAFVAFTLVEPVINSPWFIMLFGFMFWALALALILGTIIVPVSAYVGRERAAAETIGGRIRVELACPRCGLRQGVPAGTTRCGRCRAWLKVDVDEPRCECGYPLYRLGGDRCPECGREIPDDRQWPMESVAHANV